MALMKNTSDRPIPLPWRRGVNTKIMPGQTAEVEDGYALKIPLPNGSYRDSVIERLGLSLEIVDGEPRVFVEPEKTAPSAADFENMGHAPGVAEVMAAQAKQKGKSKA
jgi:hypothetical protein